MNMATRCNNWPDLLTAYIERKRHEAFAWGSNDCCLFAADWVQIATGHDIAAQWRGQYASALSAHRALNRGGGIERLVDEAGGMKIATALARRGDLVAQDGGDGVALGICVGSVAAFLARDGLQFVTFPNAKVWRF
jgi:hypothetical protein